MDTFESLFFEIPVTLFIFELTQNILGKFPRYGSLYRSLRNGVDKTKQKDAYKAYGGIMSRFLRSKRKQNILSEKGRKNINRPAVADNVLLS
jgi:hypothetical protein